MPLIHAGLNQKKIARVGIRRDNRGEQLILRTHLRIFFPTKQRRKDYF